MPHHTAASCVKKLIEQVEILDQSISCAESFSEASSSQLAAMAIWTSSDLSATELQKLIQFQRRWRVKRNVYKLYGSLILFDGRGQHSSGKLAFEMTAAVADWVKVSEFTTLSRLGKYMLNGWQLPKPDVLITIAGAHVSPSDTLPIPTARA